MKPATSTRTPILQHSLHYFPSPPITFSSQFDSGNIGRVELVSPDVFSLWTAPDCFGSQVESSCRSWFYFNVKLQPPRRLTLTIKNLNLQGKLYREGMKPVVKTCKEPWHRIDSPVSYTVAGEVATLFEVTFAYECIEEETWFAFSYPWSCSDNDAYLDQIASQASAKGLYLHRTTLVLSLEARKCDMLALSSPTDLTPGTPQAYPRPLYPFGSPFPSLTTPKSYIFVSARVHPGETPASYMLNGLLDWLVSDDPRAQAARNRFIFVIVPMLNPDGVYRGHYRLDTRGVNLNRSYVSPDATQSPTIWAVKELISMLNNQGSLHAYIDLHAHASKRGIFVYGNHMDFWREVTVRTFTKTLSLNCPYFDLEGSIFDEEHMKTKDNSGTKEGAGRVALYMATGLPLCFTLEANFNSGAAVSALHSSGLAEDVEEERNARTTRLYDIDLFMSVGKSLGVSLLDSIDGNEHSRLPASGFKTYFDLKSSFADSLSSQPQYRNDELIRKQLKSKYDFLASKSRPSLPRPKLPHLRYCRPTLNHSHSKTPSNDPRDRHFLPRPGRRLSSEAPLGSRRSAMVTPCRKQQSSRKPSCESRDLIIALI